MATYQEVYDATLAYYDGDALAAKTWVDKYALRDLDGDFKELTPDDMHHRLAREFARVEKKYKNPRSEEEIYQALRLFNEIVPQGSPMSAVGNPYKVMSTSNCVILQSPGDSVHSIMDVGKDLAQIFKRRGGAGTGLSALRPEGMYVNNAAQTTTGAWSFADYYSNIARMIGQGGRRAALLLYMDIRHPDIFKFATMKKDLSKVTGANISIKYTDAFMEAVRDDTDFTLQWPVESEDPEVTRVIRARELWDVLIEAVRTSAEPGALFWDTICRELPSDYYEEEGFKTIGCNPCFAGDTLVAVADGRGAVSIKQLAEEGLDVSVYSIDPKTGITSVKQGRNPRITGKEEQLLRVLLDNGTYIDTTLDHQFMLIGGSKCRADSLVTGSQLSPFRLETEHTALKVSGTTLLSQFHTVYNITVDDNHTVAIIVSTKNKEGELQYTGVNTFQCGELPAAAQDTCRLTTLNLYGFVRNRFEKNAYFDYKHFAKRARLAQRILDDIIDIEIESIDRIIKLADSKDEATLWRKLRKNCANGRRTGLGTFGLADTLACLGLRYDSAVGIKTAGKIFETLRNASYGESITLAKERGAFPVWDWNKEKSCPFIKRLPLKLRKDIKKFGRRNIANLTNSPTGSVAIVSFNRSSGIEPVFRNFYTRRKKINQNDQQTRVDFVDHMGDKWQEFNVYHKNVADWVLRDNPEWDGESGVELPDFFVCSDTIDWEKGVEIQGVIQQYIDHAISRTVNLPEGTAAEVIGDVYMKAWEQGLKGVTAYVDGTRTGVLVTSSNGPEGGGRPTALKDTHAPRRPAVLPCDIIISKVRGEPWVIIVGTIRGAPYELFAGPALEAGIPRSVKSGYLTKSKINKNKNSYSLSYSHYNSEVVVTDIGNIFENKSYGTFTRLLSLSMRHGAPVQHIVEQLRKDNSEELNSLSAVLGRALKKYITDGTAVGSSKACPKCQGDSLCYQDGCVICRQCGFSLCK